MGGESLLSARLSAPMRRLLWTIAQHKYGWCYCGRTERRLQTAQGLERRGLVVISTANAGTICSPTEAGRAVIERLFPVSPFILRTYDPQPEGWTPFDA